ncbi:hypothetical protein [Limisphaera ngatamarikiensis]|nr:hypothetical protein [Limisphaera ngatamarikiensis]
MESVVSAARAGNGMTVLDMIEAERRRCKHGSRYWMNSTKEVAAVGAPWELALGYVELTISTSCACGAFSFSVCLDDTYDFDPKWRKTHRSLKGEGATILVWAMQNRLACGWTPYQITGCYHGAECTF